MHTDSEPRSWHQARAAGEHTFSFDVVGYTHQGSAYHWACLVDALVDRGDLAPAARDMAPDDVLHQYEASTGDEVPSAITRDEAEDFAMVCDRCVTSLVEVDAPDTLTDDEARTIAAGWISPGAPGLTAFATGHANAPALLEDALDEITTIHADGPEDARDLMRLSTYLTAQLPYFVVTVNVPGYLPEGDPCVARGVRAMRDALRDEMERAADTVADILPSPVLALYDAHGYDVATDYATHVYDYDRGDAVASQDYTLEALDGLERLEECIADLDHFSPHNLMGGVVYNAGNLVYDANPTTRAQLEADGWAFDDDGEVDHDAMPF